MRTRFFVPVILGILLAAELSTPRASFAEPTTQGEDTCLSKPGSTAPQGSHWYYRVERATGRHCWYLGAQGAKSRTQSAKPVAQPKEATKSPPRPAVDSNPAERAEAAAAPVPSVQAVRDEGDATDSGSADTGGTPGFASRFPAVARPLDAKVQDKAQNRFSAANNYAEELAAADRQDDMPLVWPVLTSAEHAATGAAALPKVRWEYLLATIAAALALAATLIGAIFNRSSPLPSIHVDWRRWIQRGSFRRAPEPVPPRRPLGEILQAIRHAEEATRHTGAARTAFAPKRVADRQRVAADERFADPRFAANRSADPRVDELARRPAQHVPPQHAKPSRQTASDAGHDVVASLEQLLQGWQRTAA
jgi:hypothetical protein